MDDGVNEWGVSPSVNGSARHPTTTFPSQLSALRLGAHFARPFYAFYAEHPSYETPLPRWQYNAELAVK